MTHDLGIDNRRADPQARAEGVDLAWFDGHPGRREYQRKPLPGEVPLPGYWVAHVRYLGQGRTERQYRLLPIEE